jgi:flagellar assembly factor FliW
MMTTAIRSVRHEHDQETELKMQADGAPVELVQPMIGFDGARRFVIRSLGDAYGHYALMQSLDVPGLSFVVVPPGALYTDYLIEIPEDEVDALELRDASDVETWVLITRRSLPVPTANLLGPIVVNRRTRHAAQVVLQDSGYGAAVPVNAGTARPEL